MPLLRLPRPSSRDPRVLGPTVDDELTDDELTADYRIYQRRRGHRYSIDDVVTAFEACRVATAGPILDLGTGVGSVALMLAWRFADAHVCGVEAQGVSYELACRNVRRNRVGDRVRIIHGDIRDRGRDLGGPFELVTGTPPYFPPGTATPSPDVQRAFARMEYRGGIEAYLQAASSTVSSTGRVVVCCAHAALPRLYSSSSAVGLRLLRLVHVSPRVGRGPLFSVCTFRRGASAAVEETTWCARDANGARTPEYRLARRAFGLDSLGLANR